MRKQRRWIKAGGLILPGIVLALFTVRYFRAEPPPNDVVEYTPSAMIPVIAARTVEVKNEVLMVLDPEPAISELEPPPVGDSLLFAEWLKHYLPTHEEAVLAFLVDVNPSDWRASLLLEALVEHFAAKNDVFEAIDSIEVLRGSTSDYLFREVAAYLLAEHSAEEDPAKLMSFLDEQGNEEIALRARQEVGARMIQDKENRGEILELILDRPEGATRQALIDGALGRWAVEEIGGLFAYLIQSPVLGDLDRGYEITAYHIKNKYPEEAMAIAMRIQNVERRNECVSFAAFALKRKNPALYQEWVQGLEDESLKQQIAELTKNTTPNPSLLK